MMKFGNNKKIIVGVSIVVILIIGSVVGYQFNKNKVINEFREHLDTIKVNVEQYILGDNENEYNDLVSESEQAISEENKGNIKSLESKLADLEVIIISENKEILLASLEELKSVDISKSTEENKTDIETKMKEIDDLISNNKFKNAEKKIGAQKEIIDSIINSIKQEDMNSRLSVIEGLISSNDLDGANAKVVELEKEILSEEQEEKIKTLRTIMDEKKILNNIQGGYSLYEKNKNGFVIGQNCVTVNKISDGRIEIKVISGQVVNLNHQKDLADFTGTQDDIADISHHVSAVSYGLLEKYDNNVWKGKIWLAGYSDDISEANLPKTTPDTIELTFSKDGMKYDENNEDPLLMKKAGDSFSHPQDYLAVGASVGELAPEA